jgi:chromate transport protein ChrA
MIQRHYTHPTQMATASVISSPTQAAESKETSFSQKDTDTEGQKKETSTTSNPVLAEDDADMEDNSNIPKMSLPTLFWFFFYNFGLFAWGGPVAQIALIKEKLVIQDKWITLPRFQRVFAVYQILPGPEAAELCMFFGCLSAGRFGGVIAGIAFMLPGFVLMLLASYLYSLAGLENKYFNASFRALQPIVAAMVVSSSLSPSNRLLTYTNRS